MKRFSPLFCSTMFRRTFTSVEQRRKTQVHVLCSHGRPLHTECRRRCSAGTLSGNSAPPIPENIVTNEGTLRPKRQCAAGPIARTESKRKPPMKTKRARFDTLVARYYPAVDNFASRLTDDPREVVLLTQDAFNSTRKQLVTRRDEVALVTIFLNAVIRAGLTAA